MRQLRAYIIISSVLLALAGCEYKHLSYEDIEAPSQGSVRVQFLWGACPDARPQGVLMHAFSAASAPVAVPFADINGGTVSMKVGDYQLLAYNDGTELSAAGSDCQSFEVSALMRDLSLASPMFGGTRSVPRARGTESEVPVLEPDSLQSGGLVVLSVSPWEEAVATFSMREATKTWRFVINGVQNREHVVEFTATLSGMSGSWLPALAECGDNRCIVPFAMTPTGEASIAGQVRAFGHCPHELHSHMLVVYYELVTGQKYYTVFDVTPEMHKPEHWDGGDLPIVIDWLPVPEPVYSSGGFEPDVTEWQRVDIEMDL